jgi:hypothetical protein
VDEMPLMYEENTLQMEWCLNCHRNPAVNLRPTSEIYNMAWSGPSSQKPVYCAETGSAGPTSTGVTCTTTKPNNILLTQVTKPEGPMSESGTALDPHPQTAEGKTVSDVPQSSLPLSYKEFDSQIELGHFLMDKYHIRNANELSSCEVCHR